MITAKEAKTQITNNIEQKFEKLLTDLQLAVTNNSNRYTGKFPETSTNNECQEFVKYLESIGYVVTCLGNGEVVVSWKSATLLLTSAEAKNYRERALERIYREFLETINSEIMVACDVGESSTKLQIPKALTGEQCHRLIHFCRNLGYDVKYMDSDYLQFDWND